MTRVANAQCAAGSCPRRMRRVSVAVSIRFIMIGDSLRPQSLPTLAEGE